MAVVLLALVTSFPIPKSLVISSITGNKKPVDSEKTIKPADAEGPADAEKLIIICSKQQY